MLETTPGRTRVAVLISGAGSNMAALVDAGRGPEAGFEVALVLSNKSSASGLVVAATKGLPVETIEHVAFGNGREAHEQAIDAALRLHGVSVVALAGYMRVLTPWMVDRWAGRMVNIHPSLLPLYPGLDTHARALADGRTEAGCSVHLVSDGVDEGRILAQSRVPIVEGDTPESLAQRVRAAEHLLYHQALSDFCRTLD